MEQTVYSVSDVNALIKNVIDGVPELGSVYIRGELSNYKIYPSGHHYFTLKDAGSSLRCVMFKSSAIRLRFRPKDRSSFLRLLIPPRLRGALSRP